MEDARVRGVLRSFRVGGTKDVWSRHEVESRCVQGSTLSFILLSGVEFGVPFSHSGIRVIDTHPNYRLYEHKLSQGWMFGRKIVSPPPHLRFAVT